MRSIVFISVCYCGSITRDTFAQNWTYALTSIRFPSAPSLSGRMTSQSIFSGVVEDIVRE